jgi:Na+-transporting methylmalonyl-CoA/oxaloacetate decarboxylase beta subunit
MNTEVLVHLFHIVLVGGLFFYVGIKRDKMPPLMFPTLLGLGIFVAAYHLFKALKKKDAWVNYIHIFLIAPLLVFIGLSKQETPRKYFEVLLMFGFAAIGYHGYYLFSFLKANPP